MKNRIADWRLVVLFLLVGNTLNAQVPLASTDGRTPQYNPAQRLTAKDSLKLLKKQSVGISGERKKADRLYRDLGYKASVELYHRLSKEEKRDEKVLARMANSYRLNHETEEAEYWYAKFVHQSSDAQHLLHFAQVLQSNNKCEDAVRWYRRYAERVGKAAKAHRGFIQDCQELTQFKDNASIEVTNTQLLNSAHLDFSPIPYREGFVFTSTRGTDRMKIKKDNWTKDNFSDLFYAELDEKGKFKKPVPLFGEINGLYHDGVATFNTAGSMMYFTRNNNDGKSKEGLVDLKIYSARQADGYWTDIEELPFNSDQYTTCHPTLSSDGRRLYFASNRPGGYGGLDIYVCDSRGGAWGTPQNLGPTVNSAGNELFPFLNEEEILYYASNGHQGLGGLDIFAAEKVDQTDESTWTIRYNLGKKINSVKDDFGFWINSAKNEGYFSSSRKKGLGGDDIYQWKLTDAAQQLGMGGYAQDICVCESGSGQRIAKANLQITELISDSVQTTTSTSGVNPELLLTLKPLNDQQEAYVLGVVDRNASN
ncbi:MAG: hypothetical protein AAGD05_10915, partial [Bacteroidota bacterium]